MFWAPQLYDDLVAIFTSSLPRSFAVCRVPTFILLRHLFRLQLTAKWTLQNADKDLDTEYVFVPPHTLLLHSTPAFINQLTAL